MKKLSYAYGFPTKGLLGETIGQNLRKAVTRFPKSEALVSVYQKYRATYEQLWDQTTQAAKALLAAGLTKGDRLGIWAPNRYEWVIVQYAASRIGVILVNLNPAYQQKEIQYVINQSGLRMVISSLSFKKSDYRKMLSKVKVKCPTLESIIYFDRDWDNFLGLAADVPDELLEQAERMVQFDDPINIQYTSGTTGFPKGVTLSHHNILNNGYFIGVRLHYTEQDRVCIPVPFFHCFGMVIGNLCCTAHGSCMVIPSDAFDPAMTLQAVQDERCTSLYGVPTMFIAELQLPNFDAYDLRSLRTGVMAGSPCPVEVMKEVQTKMHMGEVSICYGMTETSPVSTQTIIGTSLEKQVSTVGTVMEHLEIKIIHPDTGEIVTRGEEGELCTRGYSVMLKYWGSPEATATVIDSGRWMHSGDLAKMDDEGYINISGRIKDIIIRGGENISPREIEEFLYTHPKIQDVQVIAVPDEKYGEAIMAWVKPIYGEEIGDEELIDFCRGQISHYKIPKYWKYVDAFPQTLSGKVRKVEMREISVAELNLVHLLEVQTS